MGHGKFFPLPWVIALDWMHMKYLGHDQLVYGSIFYLLTKFAMGGGSPLANLQILWGDIQSYYNSHQVPCRFRYLNKMSMFQRKEGQYPKLRGKAWSHAISLGEVPQARFAGPQANPFILEVELPSRRSFGYPSRSLGLAP